MTALRCLAFSLGLLAAVWISTPSEAADDRASVPTGPELEKAQATIRDLYKAEFAKTKAADRIALAAKLFQQALESKGDPASKFALLREARDLAAKAGDAAGVLRAADELTLAFELKPGEALSPALDALVGAAVNTTLAKQIVEVLVVAADEARFNGDWTLNAAILKAAFSVAAKAGGTTSEKVGSRQKDSKIGLAEFENAKEAFDTLKTKPADGGACTAAGRYLAFFQQEWTEGMALLSRGADEKLQIAATRDLKAASGMDEDQIAAADGWYDYAATAEATMRPGVQIRAHHWYVAAFPAQSGLNKTRIEKRIAELQPIVDAKADHSQMWAAIRRGVGDDRLRKVKLANNSNNDKTFEEMPPGGGYLVGFHYTVGGNKQPNVIQPIYMTPFGEVLGGNYGVLGKKDSARMTMKAKPGYAVGAIGVHGGGVMDGFKPVFMRIAEKGLNKADFYDGTQVGTQGELMLQGGDGTFIVGLHGKVNEKTGKIEAMAPISLLDEKAKKKKK